MIRKGEGRDVRLIIEKMNSDSPNHLTPNMLIAQTRTQTTAVYPAWWPICINQLIRVSSDRVEGKRTLVSQKVNRIVAAVISTGIETALEYQ